ncbi:MAG: DUF4832 domain-containing protein [Rubripirellula sp.]
MWSDHEKAASDAIQLEYSYMRYNDVAIGDGDFDWSVVDEKLQEIATRGHQAILRFHFVYPGKPSTVPAYIKQLPDYKETVAKSEGKPTGFVDWSHPAIGKFVLDFYSAFAKRYDKDPRLAYLQTGFGLWGEYHIYSGPRKIGETFPSKTYQTTFFQHMNRVFQQTPWMISVDAADSDYSPLEDNDQLLGIRFGLFDDSFLCKPHPKENALNWRVFGTDRWQHSPGGGEFSYYNKRDQKLSLSADGPNGQSFEDAAKAFHITFMIGNDQPKYQSMDRIREAGMATGYRFQVTKFERSDSQTRVTIRNTGIAPMYHDAFVAINGVRSTTSLRSLLPNDSQTFVIESSAKAPKLTIQSDRLLEGQEIPFAASLP